MTSNIRHICLFLGSLWILTVAPAPAQSQSSVTVAIKEPVPDGLIGDQTRVTVEVESFFDIDYVVAELDGRTDTLVFNPNLFPRPGFRGVLSLSGLSSGPKILRATAFDVFGEMGADLVSVILDRPPALRIGSPINYSVSGPLVQLRVTCADEDAENCTIRVLRTCDADFESAAASHTGSTEWSTVIDLSPWSNPESGSLISFCIRGDDSRGQGTGARREVFAESNQLLGEVANAPGWVVDVDSSRFAFVADGLGEDPGEYVRLENGGAPGGGDWLSFGVGSLRGDDTYIVRLPDGRKMGAGPLLKPGGVILVSMPLNEDDPFDNRVLEWTQGDLQEVGHSDERRSLIVSGDYAVWRSQGGIIFRRQFSSRETLQVNTAETPTQNDTPIHVRRDGSVVFRSSNTQYIYHDGALREFVADEASRDGWPCTDAEDVRPYRSLPCRLSGVLLAYEQPGNLGQSHVWLRDATGERRQRTFFSSDASLETLSPEGVVSFTYSGKRYLTSPDGDMVEISSSAGKSYFEDGSWYVAIGRSLFVLPVGLASESSELPNQSILPQTYPNPFYQSTTIVFDVPKPGRVLIRAFDVLGKQVALIADGHFQGGSFSATWNARGLPSGVYFCLVETESDAQIVKAVLAR